MLSVPGYVAVAELWGEFEQEFGLWCRKKASEFYMADEYAAWDVFGSPRDLCEDLFFSSLEKHKLSIVSADGKTADIVPVLSGSNAKLFQKASAFESYIIAHLPDEAGPDNDWLVRIGSQQFAPTRHKSPTTAQWKDLYGEHPVVPPKGNDPRAIPFHTLPVLFERPAFTIAKHFPPWANDMYEDSFLRVLSGSPQGCTICLSDESVKTWRKALTEWDVFILLKEVVPSVHFKEPESAERKGGRPRKVDETAAICSELSDQERNRTWKEIQKLVEVRLGKPISMTSLRSAMQLSRHKK